MAKEQGKNRLSLIRNEDLEWLNLSTSVGLPITLGELGVKEIDPAELRQVAEIACSKGDTMGNMPGNVTVEDVVAAILSADVMGFHYLGINNMHK